MRDIYITNTLTGKKEKLNPLKPGHIGMYACGVTVYDYCHLGHAMQAVFFDVIRRYLEYAGYEVTYVRNYTDVDDKIINRAKEQNIPPSQLAQDMIRFSDEDMRALGVGPGTHEPRVSQMIPEIIAFVQTLIDNEAAYPTKGGDVYYRVRQKPDYGKLSNRKLDELRSGTRDIVQGEKEDDLDFALWKKDDVPGITWKSPWGVGRPGWHIECSAMAKKFLGVSFDIHGGGRDLIFPHHENEIAQSESANKAPFASIWIHTGLFTINKQKMSKSLGNHLLIRDTLKTWPAEVIRLCFLEHHYSSAIDFSNQVFHSAHKRLLYYYETLAALDEIAAGADPKAPLLPEFGAESIKPNFDAAMSDDFHTAIAIADLNKVFRKARELLTQKKSPAKAATARALAQNIRDVGCVLTLFQCEAKPVLETLKLKLLPALGISKEEIDQAIVDRTDARKAKDFARADTIRKELSTRGIELRDTAQGTDWGIAYSEKG